MWIVIVTVFKSREKIHSIAEVNPCELRSLVKAGCSEAIIQQLFLSTTVLSSSLLCSRFCSDTSFSLWRTNSVRHSLRHACVGCGYWAGHVILHVFFTIQMLKAVSFTPVTVFTPAAVIWRALTEKCRHHGAFVEYEVVLQSKQIMNMDERLVWEAYLAQTRWQHGGRNQQACNYYSVYSVGRTVWKAWAPTCW